MKMSTLSSESGFNLLEVLVAILIFALIVTAIFYAQTQASRKYSLTKEETLAALLAQNIMAETEAKYEAKAFEKTAKSESGEGKGAFVGYKWRWTIRPMPVQLPSFSQAAGAQGEESNSEDEQFGKMVVELINTHLKETWRELSVDISWKSVVGDEERKYSLTTHLVDLSQKPNFGLPTGGGSGGSNQSTDTSSGGGT